MGSRGRAVTLVAEPPSSNVQLSEQQAERALIFGNYAFRFIICHEMAHIALGHIRPGLLSSREIDGEIRATLSARHDSELAADRFGFTLHMKALESPLLVVTALAAVIYFLHSTYLLRLRLMLLAKLVDYHAWEIEGSHPPILQRVLNLSDEAISQYGETAWDGLKRLNGDLQRLEGEVIDACSARREGTIRDAQEVVGDGLRCISHGGFDEGAPEALTSEIAKLYQRSPIALAEAFDESARVGQQSHDQTIRHSLDRLMTTLPIGLRNFLGLSQRNRSRRCLLKPLLADE